jgi:hypothetical protein
MDMESFVFLIVVVAIVFILIAVVIKSANNNESSVIRTTQMCLLSDEKEFYDRYNHFDDDMKKAIASLINRYNIILFIMQIMCIIFLLLIPLFLLLSFRIGITLSKIAFFALYSLFFIFAILFLCVLRKRVLTVKSRIKNMVR